MSDTNVNVNVQNPLESPLYIELESIAVSLKELYKNIFENVSEPLLNGSETKPAEAKVKLDITAFKLNDSKNGEYNVPLYVKLINDGKDEKQLNEFIEQLTGKTEAFFKSVEGLIESSEGIEDNNTIGVLKTLSIMQQRKETN